MSEGTVGKARRHPVKEQDTAYRDDYQRDRDRVLYSSAFRRLAGVAQVAAVNEQLVLHNRLTHSLKVAQMGRRLVQHLRYQLDDPKRGFPEGSNLNEDVVETAGLVHDIGHPPFGHIAEEVLDQRLAQISGLEGFEGNAQSFRVVTKLARRKMEHPGLNLTQATLNAILKYPRLKHSSKSTALWTDRGYGDKWGAYQTEKVDFDWARQGSRGDLRSANAVLMDWADDISYATHDLEDYFRAGLIPLHSLSVDKERILKHGLRRLKQYRGFDEFRFRNELETIIAEFGGRLHSQCWETRKNRVQMNKISSGHLTRFVKAVRLLGEPPYVEIEQSSQYRVAALKELTWFYVINRPPLAIQQEGQKRIIGSLFDRLMMCLEKSPISPKIPIQLRGIYRDITQDDTAEAMSEKNKEAGCARAVTDYICLLTEAQAVDLGERLAGRSQSSMFGTWFN
ncbi:deoxyguanosinetriphosphate triphosphohydrolase family protein [Amycolatopsis keratiniphila]|uniref:deoxyguanosinetriphosphate triphosphohydrolase family protein n=1 Tax=Amycolatopsis keratiniphila TaxID=129921 RepID=UPI00087DF002|nr:dNTP triphosphohydrolase [Amycolatopsis keratiniphila]OLZ52940.1 deoxyguanosinetriphosphate triphosphohydrolase [Amycolatopsis keratiniphila subsp. nogabecina]SDU06518.1 dGTPase [Amycolatopsis keratiniphila]